jgi:site-specific DNA-methyltransferase (adenine-specific)
MDFMRELPDKAFSLAIVDPPYGETCKLSGGKAKKDGYGKYWDKITEKGNWNVLPPPEFFKELFRVSKNQIIWGANHYTSFLPHSSGWIFWDKGQRDFSFSDGENAFTSFQVKLRAVTIHRSELHIEDRFHPTQKPVKLYTWLLQNYAKQGDTILDTHLGSGSSRIAAYDMGFDFTGIELDNDYFYLQEKRFAEHKAKQKLFTPEQLKVTQTKIL